MLWRLPLPGSRYRPWRRGPDVTETDDQPRDWEQIRADAVAAVRAAGTRKTADIIDIVLSVCDEETVRRLTAKLIKETGIRAMDFRDGVSMDLEPARDAVAHWVGVARGMLGDAPNYSETRIDYGLEDPPGYEMTVKLAGELDRYVFRLQRAGKLTPHEARVQAEERAGAAAAELARIREDAPESGFEVQVEWSSADMAYAASLTRGRLPWHLDGALVGMGRTPGDAVTELAGIARYLVIHGENFLAGQIPLADREWLYSQIRWGTAPDDEMHAAIQTARETS